MGEEKKIVSKRIGELLEEMIDLIKPDGTCGDPDCMQIHDTPPEGPWMITGWAMAVDLTAESIDNDDVETWTLVFRSRGLPRTQCLGLGATIVDSAGG